MSRGATYIVATISAVLVGMAVMVVVRMLDAPPGYDELLQYFAAEGIRAQGAPVILDGIYTRAWRYSMVLGYAQDLLGDGLVAARLVAMLAWLATLATVGWVAWRWFGMVPALVAVALVATDATSIHAAGQVRFYSAHALVVLLLVLAGLRAGRPGEHVIARFGWLLLFTGLAWLAFHLQPSTVIPLAAMLFVLSLAMACSRWSGRRELDLPPVPALILAGLVVAGLAGLLLAQKLELGVPFASGVGPAPPWLRDGSADLLYYARHFWDSLGLLFPALLLTGACGIAWGKPPTRILAAIGVLCLALHIIASAKAARYVVYMLPILGLVMAGGIHALAERLPYRRTGFAAEDRERAAPSVVAAALLLSALLAASPAAIQLVRAAVSETAHWPRFRTEPDWRAITQQVVGSINDYDVVMTSAGVKALWALGRYDFEVNRSAYIESRPSGAIGTDRRTGRELVASGEVVARILSEAANPLFVADAYTWGARWGVSADTTAWVEAVMVDISLDPEVKIFVRSRPGVESPGQSD